MVDKAELEVARQALEATVARKPFVDWLTDSLSRRLQTNHFTPQLRKALGK